MTRAVPFLVLVLGCGSEPSVTHSGSKIAVIDTYEKDFNFDLPVPCRVFLHRRVTDEAARFVEYDARIAGVEVSAIYSIDASVDHPLAAEIFHGPTSTLRVDATDHDLRALAGGVPHLLVSGYDGAHPRVEIVAPIDDPEGLSLLACALPVRIELGPVPAFLLNRASGGRDPQDPDVSHTSSNPQPILDWKGAVSLLGVYVLEGACLTADQWSCPCLDHYHNDLVGAIRGGCSILAPTGNRSN